MYSKTVLYLQGTKVCDIGDDLKEKLRQFRFRKATTSAALICLLLLL